MAHKLTEYTTVSAEDLWVLLCSTIRYSMGRKTYMTSLAPELVMKYQNVLLTSQLRQIRNEVKAELDRVDASGIKLGWECDDHSWRKFVWELTELLEQRAS